MNTPLMKRYSELTNSDCLNCGQWLCVTAGAYTGVVNCPKCGAGNVFDDSLKPLRTAEQSRIPKEGK